MCLAYINKVAEWKSTQKEGTARRPEGDYNRSTPKTWDAPIVMYEILCTYNFFFYEKTGFSAE